MDGYGPGKPQRVLAEYTQDFGVHLLGLLIDDITAVLPFKRFYRYLLVLTGTLHQYIFFAEIRHRAYLSVIIVLLA